MSSFHTHPEWQALLAGICAEPFGDLRRLVAADWLTENGEEERAEFIRLQIDGSDDEREMVLFGLHADQWWPGMNASLHHWNPAAVDPATHYVVVARGLPGTVIAPLVWLIGGECVECHDPTGEWTGFEPARNRDGTVSFLSMVPCLTCHGAGRTPGHLDELVRGQPITQVVVTDAIRRVGHGWGAPHDFQPMPSEVWEEFTSTDEGYPFETEQAASDALGLALLTTARERAGLPFLSGVV